MANSHTSPQHPLASALCATLLLGACVQTGASSELRPTGFPAACEANEVQVMLLGTYRFAGVPADPVRQSPDDVLSIQRQEELQELAAQMADWAPQQIAVDWPANLTDSTTARYRRFVAEGASLNRSEVVQLGFRIARRLRHADVFPFDRHPAASTDSVDALFRRRPELRLPLDATVRELWRTADSLDAWRRVTTLSQHLYALNTDAALRGGNSEALFGGYLAAGDGANTGGAEVLAAWYEWNILMAHQLARLVRPETRRLLVLVEASHVPALRNILHEAPQFCPVSPLPFLR